VEALLKLAAFTDPADYRMLAEQSFRLVTEPALRYPTNFARWLGATDFALAQVRQVAILGDLSAPETRTLIQTAWKNYRPNMVIAAAPLPSPENTPSLLADRPLINGQPTAYVCEGFICKMPNNNEKC
jgi:uncharacterized protein